MSVSVSMPQLGESVTEGTVTRWLKQAGDHVSVDEPLLEVSTDKVDTEIPSPVSGILRGITVAEDETVAVGAELAVIDEDGAGDPAGGAAAGTGQEAAAGQPGYAGQADPAGQAGQAGQPGTAAYPSGPYAEPAGTAPYAEPATSAPYAEPARPAAYQPSAYVQPPAYVEPPAYQPPAYTERPAPPAPVYAEPPAYQPPRHAERPVPPAPVYAERPVPPAPVFAERPAYQPPAYPAVPPAPVYAEPPTYQLPQDAGHGEPAEPQAGLSSDHADGAAQADAEPTATAADTTESPYVTPLVRKLAAEHGIDLSSVAGTGVGGRIRKQDVLDAARDLRGAGAPAPDPAQPSYPPPTAPAGPAAPAEAAMPVEVTAPAGAAGPALATGPVEGTAPVEATAPAGAAGPAEAVVEHAGLPGSESARPQVAPSALRGSTERLSRARQVIAQRMVESLQSSAQLTTVVEADVTAIARLRDRARAAFEAREGVKLSFLPFFALAAVEALKVHPKLNASVDVASGTVSYHDAEHLGIAVDTDRGLMVPVIRNAGDLNIGGLARKVADLAQRTRASQVSPDDLSGGTFTLTNTGSRGALFDTPIINMPQVAILGTGTVNKRAAVMEDPALGEVITVRSMVYLALTYDHRLVDGADAARFLVTIKSRLEEGAFEAELGL